MPQQFRSSLTFASKVEHLRSEAALASWACCAVSAPCATCSWRRSHCSCSLCVTCSAAASSVRSFSAFASACCVRSPAWEASSCWRVRLRLTCWRLPSFSERLFRTKTTSVDQVRFKSEVLHAPTLHRGKWQFSSLSYFKTSCRTT